MIFTLSPLSINRAFNSSALLFELNVEVTKVHRLISYKQKPFLYPYIDRLQKIRKTATDQGFKSTSKLSKDLGNSNFGKFIENPLKYADTKIAFTWGDIQKLRFQQF